MICDDYDCHKRKDITLNDPVLGVFRKCWVYGPEGQIFRDRQGYCPILGDGPNKPKPTISPARIRQGQQKSKQIKGGGSK